ncbi:MAG: DNA polymerase IV, partial [Planctomycetota bacterium]
MTRERSIIHVDLDAFFASVEQLDFPELRGKPVLVGGRGPRSVVCAASYEARQFGCHSAQPMAIALRQCPDAIVRPVRRERIRELSHRLFELCHDCTPTVQPLSVDEAFLDVTGSEAACGSLEEIGRGLKAAIRRDLGITASIGMAPNKFLAKIASDLEKPDGFVRLTIDGYLASSTSWTVRTLWGVGPSTEQRLLQVGVRTIGDLRQVDRDHLRQAIGSHADHLWDLAHGRDNRAVVADHQAKSISQEHTFEADVSEPAELERVLSGQSEQVAWRLRRSGRVAGTVTVKIRFGDFRTMTRSGPVPGGVTDRTSVIAEAARLRFEEAMRAARRPPLRLLGVGLSGIRDGGEQMSLFGTQERERQQAIDQAQDAIAARFGFGAIKR